MALALRAGATKSSANSSRASTTIASTAPAPMARERTSSQSSLSWPTSTQSAMTSTPISSIIQRTATDVSRPPL
jgi:hypothetical protein